MKVGETMNREDFVKQEIKKQGYTLKDFAAKINMPYTTLLSIINKSIGGASLDNIIKICTGLNLDIENLNPYNTDKSNNVIISLYNKLNSLGRQKADDYINDLSENPKYTNANVKTISDDIAEELKQVSTSTTKIES